MQSVLVVEGISTGRDYVREIASRGMLPVVLYPHNPGQTRHYADFRAQGAAFCAQFTPHVLFADTADPEAVLRLVAPFKPLAVVAGSELGVPWADLLAQRLGLPGNDPASSHCRRNKFAMQEALRRAGVPCLRSVCVESHEACRETCSQWQGPLVVKPLSGAGSQGVHFCRNGGEAVQYFAEVMGEPDFFGARNTALLLQEWAQGTEYIVNTVSRAGTHVVTDIWEYHKIPVGPLGNAYEYARLVREAGPVHREMAAYVRQALTALGIAWGPAHSEIMLTAHGPRLIETGARPMGGFFPRDILLESLGHCLVDVALDACLDAEHFVRLAQRPYAPRKSVLLKLFICPHDMPLAAIPVAELARWLPSARKADFTHLEGARSLPRTVDLETSPGSILLCHEDDNLLMRDYRSLRKLETRHFEVLFASEQQALPPRTIRWNGREIRISAGDEGWSGILRQLGEMSSRAASGDRLELCAPSSVSEEVWNLLLDALGWERLEPGQYVRP